MSVCVISQPTFLPWLGWFDLADQADTMIILDDVAFSKQSWQQRNRIRTPRGLEYITIPVLTSGLLGQKILDCRLADDRFTRKFIATIRGNYSKAPYFLDLIDEFESVVIRSSETLSLVELNCGLIAWIALKLGISTPMIRSSSLTASGNRGEYVAGICQEIGSAHYLSPAGAKEYLEEDIECFNQRNIQVALHEYMHPEYSQCFKPFMPNASAVDLIFNVGPMAGNILRSGRRQSKLLN